jgi:ribonuclease HII
MSKQILLKESFNDNPDIIEIGIDEAGRGALAGPVAVGACIMPIGFNHPLIKDSKLLSEPERQEAVKIIKENAIAWHVTLVSEDQIESTNILRATLQGMNDCLNYLNDNDNRFDFILVDGDQFHGYHCVPFETVVGGDNKYTSIAAASILAKTTRDNYMKEISTQYPEYGWGSNKGYGTKQHINAIKELGKTAHHRYSFISHLLTTTGQLF